MKAATALQSTSPTPYHLILRVIDNARLYTLETSLDRVVEEEARVLLVLSRSRRTLHELESARRAAESYYAEEIVKQLVCPAPLSHDRVLNNRRVANVWAVAERLREAGCVERIRELLSPCMCGSMRLPIDVESTPHDGLKRCPECGCG